jgi:glutathione S-transferase
MVSTGAGQAVPADAGDEEGRRVSQTYQIFGGPGSPYSHKVRAVFRYRRIPHTWSVPQGAFSGGGNLGSDVRPDTDLSRARKGVVPVVRYPDGGYKADSTPIIYDLESLHQGRSVIPPHAGVAFLSHLIEDMADEFLPLPMFHYRWTDDQVWCSRRQMFGWNGASSDADLEKSAQTFLDRQAGQLAGGALKREPMQQAYERFLELMEDQLRHNLFLFGTRPSLAEFGLYGQLTQYAVDPTVCTMMKERSVRTYQWTHHMGDLSGLEGDWFEPGAALTEQLAAFLRYTAEFYLPMAEALTKAFGMENLAQAANGMRYRVKTFLGIKAELASLSAEDVSLIQPILVDTGCWDPLQFKDAEAEHVVPIVPL